MVERASRIEKVLPYVPPVLALGLFRHLAGDGAIAWSLVRAKGPSATGRKALTNQSGDS